MCQQDHVPETQGRALPFFFFFFFFCFFFFLLFAFYGFLGSSQTRGRIGAEAASLYHSYSNAGSKLSL